MTFYARIIKSIFIYKDNHDGKYNNNESCSCSSKIDLSFLLSCFRLMGAQNESSFDHSKEIYNKIAIKTFIKYKASKLIKIIVTQNSILRKKRESSRYYSKSVEE